MLAIIAPRGALAIKRILAGLFKLRDEVGSFLLQHGSSFARLFENSAWLVQLAYLADIFGKLNELNLCLQGKSTDILNLYDNVGGFQKNIDLWKADMLRGKICFFPCQGLFVWKKY